MSINDVCNNNIKKQQGDDKDNNEMKHLKKANETTIREINESKTDNSSSSISLKTSDDFLGSKNENQTNKLSQNTTKQDVDDGLKVDLVLDSETACSRIPGSPSIVVLVNKQTDISCNEIDILYLDVSKNVHE